MVRHFTIALLIVLSRSLAAGADPAGARHLAAQLDAARQGDTYVRFVMKVNSPAGSSSLQIQVKERRASAQADVLYQVLWPAERKGEGVLLHERSGSFSDGNTFVPPQTETRLAPAQLSKPLLGSHLAIEDAIEDPYSWSNQTITGEEKINNVPCTILESKPSAGQSSYSKVISWIDTRRMVPMRIEKFSTAGALIRRIDVTRFATDDKGRSIPADLAVTTPGQPGQTILNGSKIHTTIAFSDSDFRTDAFHTVSIPH